MDASSTHGREASFASARTGDQVHLSYVMGGLVKDISDFHDVGNAIGGDPARSIRNIAADWLDASACHGMPVRAEGGLDVGRFRTSMRDGSAAADFQRDLATTAAHGVRGFPAFLVHGRAERALRLPGYQTHDTFREVIRLVSQGTTVGATLPKAPTAIADFVNTLVSATDVEITTTFDLTQTSGPRCNRRCWPSA